VGAWAPNGRTQSSSAPGWPLGGLDPAPTGEVTCLYTSTASEDFILDRYGPFVVCSPCSGHGAKFAPLVGEITADLACGGASPDPASPSRRTAHPDGVASSGPAW